MGLLWKVVPIFVVVVVHFFHTCASKPLDPPSASDVLQRSFNTAENAQASLTKVRPLSWSTGTNTEIRANGRNLIIPKEGSGRVPVFRAESNSNQRLNEEGIIGKKTVYLNIGGNPDRTQTFMQQARTSEPSGAKEILKAANEYRNGYHPQTEAGQQAKKEYIYNENLKAFNANGQTIRSGTISTGLARTILGGSVPEDLNKAGIGTLPQPRQNLLFNPNVQNVDITKGYNQVGVKGSLAKAVDRDLAEGGVQEGTTFGGRRNSAPVNQTRFTDNEKNKARNLHPAGTGAQERRANNNQQPASNSRQANNQQPASNNRQGNNQQPASNNRQGNNRQIANNNRQQSGNQQQPKQTMGSKLKTLGSKLKKTLKKN